MFSTAQKKAKRRGIALDGDGGYKRHILLCTGCVCCGENDGKATWRYLSKRLVAL